MTLHEKITLAEKTIADCFKHEPKPMWPSDQTWKIYFDLQSETEQLLKQ